MLQEQRWKVVLGPWIVGELCLQEAPAEEEGILRILGRVQSAAWLDRLAGKKLIETRLESKIQKKPWRSLEYQQSRQEMGYTALKQRSLNYEQGQGALRVVDKNGKVKREKFQLAEEVYQDPLSFLWGIFGGGLEQKNSPISILETKNVVSLAPRPGLQKNKAILFQEIRAAPGLKKEVEFHFDPKGAFACLRAVLGPLDVWVVPAGKISGSGRQSLYGMAGGFLAGIFLRIGLDRPKKRLPRWKILVQRCLGFGGIGVLLILWLGTENVLAPNPTAFFWMALSFVTVFFLRFQLPLKKAV